MDITSTVRLNCGAAIPRLGLGVFRSGKGQGTRDAVRWALAHGYRHIDTAHIYANEADVAAALRDSEIPREDIWVTTKLWNDHQGYDSTLRAFDDSLQKLGLDYLDLYLIHWPVPDKRRESWRAMEAIAASGRCRAIGVSNFMVHHLDDLLAGAKVVPAVNQIELSPFLQQHALVDHCRALGIVMQAYSPLTKGRRLDDSRLVAIARQAGRSPAQVLIRWALQKGLVVLPKSASEERIRENAAVFDFSLAADDMATLDAMDENLHTAWDPSNAP